MHRPPRTLARRLAGGTLAGTLGIALVGGLAPAAHAADTITVSITPAAATVLTGTDHDFTVTATQSDGTTTTPLGAAHLIVTVDGVNGLRVGGAPADANGQGFFVLKDGVLPGLDTITVCVDQNSNGSCAPGEPTGTATVTWKLNHAPTADDQTVVTGQRRPTPITLTGSDPDQPRVAFGLVTMPMHGSLVGSPTGLLYTPEAGFTGVDSFDFQAEDGVLHSDPATVTILVLHDATLTVRQEHRPRITVNALLKTLVPADSSARPRKIVVTSDDGQELIQLTLNRSASDDRRNNRSQRYVGTLTFNRRGKVVKLPVKASWNGTTRTVTGEWERGHDEGKFTLMIDPAPMASGALKAS